MALLLAILAFFEQVRHQDHLEKMVEMNEGIVQMELARGQVIKIFLCSSSFDFEILGKNMRKPVTMLGFFLWIGCEETDL